MSVRSRDLLLAQVYQQRSEATLRVSHETPGSDLDWKVKAPLIVETPSGAVVTIERWSLAGLEWPDDAPECPKAATLSVPFQGVDIRFPVRLSKPNSNSTVQLEGLSGRQRETLALFYRSLLSGRMASSGDVITSLDTPVDLVPMEETEGEQSRKPVRFLPRSLRVAFNVATYLLIAAAVVGVIGNNIFTNLDRIDIQHGRVLAPMIPSFPPAKGYIKLIAVTPGQEVLEGDLLFLMDDAEAEAALKRTEAELVLARAELSNVNDALKNLQSQSSSEILAERVATAMRFYAEFVQDGGFDDMRRQWLSLRERNPDLAQSVDPVLIVANLLKAEERNRSSAVKALEATKEAQQQIIESNHVRATTDGVVQDFTVSAGQPFRGTPEELIFETAEPRMTIGWVSERFAETIYIGMPATIGFNEKGERISIPGEVWDVRAGDNPERPGEFGIIVTVRPTGLSSRQTKTQLRLGAPVNLEAKRQLGTRFGTWIKSMDPSSGQPHD
ncbi:HlyD family secretion protein [Ruegeria arenilitoris]|uniref:HlyD family secretion protein n=1 Tax=Ruegeria arenilitoris TaxID=1173585 RepID=UPI00147D041F